MNEYDYICAQNYVEQVYRARTLRQIDRNESILYLVRCGCYYEKRAFGQLRPWNETREGRPVWTRRHDAFCELVDAGVIKLYAR